MIGLSILLPNVASNYLIQILENVDVDLYEWNVSYDEVLYMEDDKEENSLFKEKIISGDEFKKCISRKEYYLVFIDVKGFPINSTISNVISYDDYLRSECEIVLLCADSRFVDIFSKKKDILQTIYTNCINYELQVEKISKQNNTRTRLDV